MAKSGFVGGLIVLISLFGVLSPSPVITAPEEVRWYPQAMPSEGEAGIDYIVDIAVSPDYDWDNTLFMLTWGGSFSLWRGNTESARWERVFSSLSEDVYDIRYIELSPQYGSGSRVLYMAGSTSSGAAIWKSDDGGQSFICRGTPLPVDAWAVLDDTTLFIAGYDGSRAVVYKTQDGCQSYSNGVVCGSQYINCLALSPNYSRDGTILAGNCNGWILLSEDYGNSFEPLPPSAVSASLSGNVNLAFDAQFGSNHTVYAAGDSSGGGIYRFIIGFSSGWEAIDATLSPGAMLGGLGVSTDGVLYASDFQQVDTGSGRGGMQRCLEPSSGGVFEAVTSGLDDGATLVGLWLHGNRIWSIDTTNIRLMAFVDSLARPVSLEKPADRTTAVGTLVDASVEEVRLDWQPLSGASGYRWQLDDDDSFSSIADGFGGDTTASSVDLPLLEPGKTYYWRVRVYKPLLGPWSEIWSFTTSAEDGFDAPVLEMPQDGALDVSIRPLFCWSAVAGADGYELIVDDNTFFSSAEIENTAEDTLLDNIWQSDVSLLYATTYYWKVRAVDSASVSAWSSVSSFTTEAQVEPEEETTQEEEQTAKTEATLIVITTLMPPSLINLEPPPETTPALQTHVPAATTELPAPTQPSTTLVRQPSDDSG
jgi:hypothetical protein